MPLSKKLKSKNGNNDKNVEDEKDEESSSIEEESMSENDEDDDDEDGSGDDDFNPNEEIMIDFEARSLLESDLDSVKIMIQQKLAQFPFNINELSKIVVQQDSIGNAIYQAPDNKNKEDESEENEEDNEDDTIFGVLSLIDLGSPRTKNFSTNFVQWIKSQAENSDKSNSTKIAEKVNDLFKNKNVSYAVNERYINIPPGISVPMFESLLKDISNLSDDSPNKKSEYWLFLAKYFTEEVPKSKSSSSRASSNPEVVYANPEEEVFEEFNEIKFEIPYGAMSSKASSGKWSKDDPTLTPSLNCIIVPISKIPDALAKIKTLI